MSVLGSRSMGAAAAILFSSSSALAGSIAGRVLDPSGRPVGGAKVQRLGYRSDERVLLDRTSGKEPAPSGETATEAQGRFRLVLDRPAAAFSLRVFARGFASLWLPGPYFGREDVALEDLVAEPARPLSGRVVDDSGAAVAGARVRVTAAGPLLEEDALMVGEALTAANGAFAILDAPEGPRSVIAFAPGFVIAERTQIEPRGEERLVLARGGAVRGVVTDGSGRGVSGAVVTAETVAVETDASGAYLLSGLAPGVHSIVALSGEDFAARRDGVRFRKKHEIEVPLRLARAAAVSGVVLNESTRRPVAGARVEVSEARGFAIARRAVVRRGRTDGRGRYRIGALAARPYSVAARRDGFLPSTIGDVVASVAGGTSRPR